MGQVKKLLILLGKPGYWLVINTIRLVFLVLKAFKNLKNKLPEKKTAKQISIPFPKKRINKKTLALVLIIIGIFLVLAGILVSLFKDLPKPDQLVERPSPLTTKIYDRNDELLFKIYQEENRTLATLDKIPDHMIKATLAIEDKNFYEHNGLSWRGIFRAIRHNVLNPNQTPMGGSTITQQLIKNSLLTPEKTWRRKTQEAILSIWAEKIFNKDEILQMYFNEIPYGGTAYGVEEASQKYFNKHVWNLKPAESALLAGLTRAPSDFSPFGSYPEKAKDRQKKVITEMIKAGFITKKEADKIILDRLRFNLEKDTIKAPHFVFYVKDWLIKNFGQELVEKGGLQVKTTLDWPTQQKIESIVRDEVNNLDKLNVTNGAALVVNPKKGEITAMVGSKDYFDFKNDGNVNVTLRPRQPGSSIKPINYAVALQKGYTAATILSDTPITYRLPGQKPYSPVNYDGKFRGKVSLRTALGSSLNVPATKVLSSYGVNQMIDMGKRMGITTWENKNRFGLSLTLGGGEVKMIDLAQTYSVFANLGKKINLNPVLEIKNQKNEIIYQHPCANFDNCPGKKVLDPGIAFIINDILADNQARELAFGPNSLLNFTDRKVAVKTGTSNNLRDNWAIGHTPNILVSVWVGNNDNSPMSRIASGITGATPIWREIIDNLLTNSANNTWKKPDNVIQTTICQTTGTLPCEECPQIVDEYFLKGTEPTTRCSFEKNKKDNKNQ
jgi:penicillin-binding protein 1C